MMSYLIKANLFKYLHNNKSMQISLIGPGKIELHYQKLLSISLEEFNNHIKGISKALVNANIELDFLPDTGVNLEIAKKYKELGGKKVTGVIPESDIDFGVKHLEQYKSIQVNNRPLFDEFVDSENWYKHNSIKTLFGNACLYLGNSPGTEWERNAGTYLYYLMKGMKKDLKISLKKLNPSLNADENFTFFIYSPFLKTGKLSFEDEFYLKEYGIALEYIKDTKDLEIKLKKFNSKSQ